MKPEIALISGAYFNFLEPDPNVITLDVIAHALTFTGRYTGHTRRFYSVAEHSILCYMIDPTPETLMHDAAEAFLGDVSTPLKMLLPEYKEIEANVERVIADRFGLMWPMSPATRNADLVALTTEKRDLLPYCGEWEVLQGIDPLPYKISPVAPDHAEIKRTFLQIAREAGLQ